MLCEVSAVEFTSFLQSSHQGLTAVRIIEGEAISRLKKALSMPAEPFSKGIHKSIEEVLR